MRILYLSQYFPPEAGATQTRAHEMARTFVQNGHQVTMLSEIPNHPSGIIHPGYRRRLYERSSLDGIDVIRVWVKTSPIKNFRTRMLLYLSYMVTAFLAGLLLARSRYDLVYATSPPLFTGASALGLSLLKRAPMVFEVRDLWPETAIALGELSNPVAVSLATRLEEACYRRSRKIVVVTQGIRTRLVHRGIPSEKIVLVPNGANVDLFRFKPDERQRLRDELDLEGKFVAMYAGILGVAQGLETLVEAAWQLRHDPGVHFILIGEGPKKAEIEALAHTRKVNNLTFLPEQPRESIPGYLSAADAALIPLRKLELFKGTLPSKMFDAWACQRPLLLSIDGEARALLDEAGGGIYIPPEDVQGLVRAVQDLKANPVLGAKMGERGRCYTVRHFSRQSQAEILLQHLQTTLE
jgi:colanic acid biosynthesis glycosyl transferase WcaI